MYIYVLEIGHVDNTISELTESLAISSFEKAYSLFESKLCIGEYFLKKAKMSPNRNKRKYSAHNSNEVEDLTY